MVIFYERNGIFQEKYIDSERSNLKKNKYHLDKLCTMEIYKIGYQSNPLDNVFVLWDWLKKAFLNQQLGLAPKYCNFKPGLSINK